MIEAYKNYWSNYTNFTDRTSRSGYWLVVLMNLIISVLIGIVAGIVCASMGFKTVELAEDYSNFSEYITSPSNMIALIWGLINLIPGLAIFARRMHDTNRSGWLYLLLLIPIVNFVAIFVLLVFLCQDSVNEGNKYGDKLV